jgi:hypothetical protein
VPRIWTPPLRELTEETTYGYRLIEFAESIGEPFDPYQEWLSVHAGELLPDGNPRFRIILILISRQAGKTKWAKIWILFMLFVWMPGRYPEPLLGGLAAKLEYAKETWQSVVSQAQRVEMLAAEIPRNGVRTSNGDVTLSTVHGTRYKIAAANEDAFRSLTLQRLYVDEVRRLKNFTAWDAAEPTTSAVRDAQIILTSNQGDDTAVVLDALRNPAIEFIQTGQGDETLGLFEWSARDGADPTSVPDILQANPNAGYRMPVAPLLKRAARAKAAGGKQLASWKTEQMCMRVANLDPAIDPLAWADCADPDSMDDLRDRVGLVLDVAPDQQHAILVAGALQDDGRVRLEVVESWRGRGCIADVERELPALVAKVKARAFGWFPIGPAASLQARLADPAKRKAAKGRRRSVPWPPPRVQLVELTAETPGICMGFAEAVISLDVAHSDDPLLNLHMESAQKQWILTRWVFGRPGTMPVNGAYAGAGAWYLAKTLPPPMAKRRLVVAH